VTTGAVEQVPEILSLTGSPSFINPDVAASYFGDLLGEKYGTEWLGWEPETLWQTIKQDMHTDIHPVNKEKINAVKTLLLVDDFWTEWHIFENIVKALNHQIPSFYMMEGCTPGEMAWAVEEVALIRQEAFNDEIKAYVRACCINHGYVVFPAELAFAQEGISTDLEQAVFEAWRRASSRADFEVAEDQVGVQLARLNSVRHYVNLMREKSDGVLGKGER